jgi:hypothetical protein
MRKQEGYFVCADNMQPMLKANHAMGVLPFLNTQVKDNGGALDQEQADAVRIEYRALLMEGEVECPPPDEDKEERSGESLFLRKLVLGVGPLFCRNRSASVGVDKTKGIPTRCPVI